MMGREAASLSLLVLALVHTAYSSYVVMAPSTFRPGWEYRVQITVSNTNGGSPVTVSGNILDSSNRSLFNEGQTTVSDGGTGRLHISIPASFKLKKDNRFTLRLKGSGGLSFTNSTSIQLDQVTTITFVQTDKAIYKPKDLVRFRVVTVDQELKPVLVGKTITIKNSVGSSLHSYQDDGSKAVFEGTYQLTEFPGLGHWKIKVTSVKNNIEQEYPFEVDEYVLPKFEVTAAVSPGVLLLGKDQLKAMVDVTAKYTYGKGVMGDVLVVVGDMQFPAKITESNGRKEVAIDLPKMKNEGNVDILVNVTDTTGRTYSAQAMVKVKSRPIMVEFDRDRSDKVFRPGTSARVVIKVTDHKDEALGNDYAGNTLTVNVHDGYSSGKVLHTKTFDLGTGDKEFVWTMDQLMTANDNLEVMAQVSVRDKLYTARHSLRKYMTLGNATLNARWTKYTTEMWSTVEFAIDMYTVEDFDTSTLSYLTVSRGTIQAWGTGSSGSNTVRLTPDLCPKADVIVFGLTASPTPEIIADRLEIHLKGCQNKEVTPSVEKAEQRTGTEAAISVDVSWTDSGRTEAVGKHDVFMLAVDQSLLLLQGSNHDLTRDKVDKELEKFKLDPSDSGDGPMPMGRDAFFGPPPGEAPTSTGELLKKSGLKLLADVIVSEEPFIIYDEVALAGGGVEDEDTLSANEGMVPESGDTAGGAAKTPEGPKTVTVRKDFPDTWIWKSKETNENGQLTLMEKLPDSITSWVISAFAVKSNSEIALTTSPAKIAAFNPFFVDLNLPYSIRRLELFTLRTTVFNYNPSSMNVKVTLKQSQDFQIVGSNAKELTVEADNGMSVDFVINATRVKTISLVVNANGKTINTRTSAEFTDIVTKSLIVKPEGKERTGIETLSVILKDDHPVVDGQRVYEKEITFNYGNYTPNQIVPESKRAVVKITADMMGNVLKNIDDLVSQPTGCGEQNMITTIPNIYAMNYLVAVQDTTLEFNTTAKQYMMKGYDRETQQYRYKDGGYSAFGERDGAASTWLTAFVVRSFAQAKRYIELNDEFMKEDVKFLLNKQIDDGRFLEEGRVLHDAMQGGTGTGDARSVYVAMCLMEASKLGVAVDQAKLDLSVSFVKKVAADVLNMSASFASSEKSEEDKKQYKVKQFLAAITAYTLTLQEPVDAATVNGLISFIRDTGAPWIEKEDSGAAKPEPRMYYPHAAGPSAIEITSYCILALNGMDRVIDARDLMTWLQTKQNDRGGYTSTQDTVMALQAISELAARYSNTIVDSTVSITPLEPGSAPLMYSIDNANKRLLKIFELPDETKKVKVEVKGSVDSLTLVKVVWYYYTKPEKGKPQLTIQSKTKKLGPKLQTVETCISLESGFTYDNMMVMTMESPSCHMMDNILEARDNNPSVKRMEEDGDRVHFYMDKASDTCIRYKMVQECDVENLQPGLSTVYAYYKPDEIRAEADLKMALVECVENCDTDSATSLSGLVLTACICLLLSLLATV